MTGKEAILHNLRGGGPLVSMFTSDLTNEHLHHRVVPDANCAAWLLGHLILSERRAMMFLGTDEASLPALPSEDFAKKFGRSDDAPACDDFGDATLLPDLFQEHRTALVQAVEAADDAKLDEALPEPMRIANTIGELLLFFPVHVATHLGQISTIRRTLGMPPVI